jgi:small subunit ribosomal protein S17
MSEEPMDEGVTVDEGGEDSGAKAVQAQANEGVGQSEPVEAPVASPSGNGHRLGAAPAQGRGRRKVREGIARSVAMDKTVVVEVIERVRHPRYGKTVQRSRHLYVHDEANEARSGDRVRVAETRPLSKTKRWRLVEIVERAR